MPIRNYLGGIDDANGVRLLFGGRYPVGLHLGGKMDQLTQAPHHALFGIFLGRHSHRQLPHTVHPGRQIVKHTLGTEAPTGGISL